ncbi:MAG: polyketide cyclase [Nitrosomonas sp.]|uniref:polyketide cyclase n=1 Tax=Nitrosomonas sp. TaxID=42353 RepID=UPI001A5576D8|nr:polyketide cyclase [Nitrosomonas sp.]MBL8499997.1 polyketide cyclase [Nitrosomonas sp.]MCG7755291.1 polyketide cyclase [Nitrosomonas sp.]UJP00843.1 MAG: polyketide cyclase [Nitrosomonas sp.]UJP03984.1 MAG: polyketide cyclase [Nitrosomonas sp.]UJP08362.1 MAG: polyketide cyclase [Nitrosomonas sp.]
MLGLFKDSPVIGKASAIIQSPTDKLFNFIGNDLLINYPRWSPEVKELEKLTDGPIKLGTVCRQVRIDQGNRSESTFKVKFFDIGMRICFEGVSNPYRCDYVIESVNASDSRITFIFELLSLDLHVRPFEKLVRIAVQDGTERTVKNIKKLIEAE